MSGKCVYCYGAGEAEGAPGDHVRLGVKGAGLHDMTRMGLPVPPGFTIVPEVGAGADRALSRDAQDQIREAVGRLEVLTGRRFGRGDKPLLVSVRSGSRVSMPGMLSTILDVGMSDAVVAALLAETRDATMVWDSRRRFIARWGEVVLSMGADNTLSPFDSALYDVRRGAERMDAPTLEALGTHYETLIRDAGHRSIPEDPYEQLFDACVAVFNSWDNPACKAYRARNAIPDAWCTAVNVCAMVYGNASERSATGVAFTHDPSTGERRFFGEYLDNAQGEDVVSGTSIPRSLIELEGSMPDVYRELAGHATKLESHYRTALDIEFTVERGKLWILQARPTKPAPAAALRIALDFVDEGVIDAEQAVLRVSPDQVSQLLRSSPDVAGLDVVARGLAASPGVVTGRAMLSADAVDAAAGTPAILLRVETNARDVQAMQSAAAIVTAKGGLTCHAAIVARALGRPCVVGAAEIRVDEARGEFSSRGRTFPEGELLTVDGAAGTIMVGGAEESSEPAVEGLDRFMAWVDAVVSDDKDSSPMSRLERAQVKLRERDS